MNDAHPMDYKEKFANRNRRRKTPIEREMWKYIAEYSKCWIYPDSPRSWSADTSSRLGYGEGWLASLRNRNTSVAISSIVEVCGSLSELRPKQAPSLCAAIAFAAADRRLKGAQDGGILCIELPLIDQLQLSREAKEHGRDYNQYVRDILLNHTRG